MTLLSGSATSAGLAAPTITDSDWDTLVGAIADGSCILMIGPDAFQTTVGDRTLPTAVALAEFVRMKLGARFEWLDPTAPFTVAEIAVNEKDPRTLRTWIREFYTQVNVTSPALHHLARLPFPLIVNTSPGLAGEAAFGAHRPHLVTDFYDRTAATRGPLAEPTNERPLLYQLFGSLTEPASVILSESDSFEFLVSVISAAPKLPDVLTSTLKDPDKSFLFVGFHLGDWQLRLLMHVLAKNRSRPYRSFAFEFGPALPDETTRTLYEVTQKVSFFSMGLEEFAAELSRRAIAAGLPVALDEVVPLAPPPIPAHVSSSPRPAPLFAPPPITTAVPAPAARLAPPTGAAAGPTSLAVPRSPTVRSGTSVFMCHDNDDRDVVHQLSDRLLAEGFDTWFDQDDLHVGTDWDASIQEGIRTVDYFVVAQSRQLSSKREGYVFSEIRWALERSRRMAPGRVFILPVALDGMEFVLPALSEIQTVDLTKPGGFVELVQQIRRDESLEHRSARA